MNSPKLMRVKSPSGLESSTHHIRAVSTTCCTSSATERAPGSGRKSICPDGTLRSSAMTPRRASAQASSASSSSDAVGIYTALR